MLPIIGFALSFYIALGLFMLWWVCRLVAPANTPLLAGVRVGAIVYYLAFCMLLLLPFSDFVHSLYGIEPWGHYVVRGMGLDKDDAFHNVFVLALWVGAPAGWIAARSAYRNLPF